MKRIIASVIVLFIALAAGGSALDRAPEPAPELPQQTAPAEESIEVTAPTESVEAEEPAPEEAPVGICLDLGGLDLVELYALGLVLDGDEALIRDDILDLAAESIGMQEGAGKRISHDCKDYNDDARLDTRAVAAGSYYVGNDESNGNNELDYFAFDYRGLIGFVQGLKGLGLASPKDFFSGLQNRAQHIFHTDPPQFTINFYVFGD